MAKARVSSLRAIVVLIAGLLAAAVVWAGSALGGGSGGATNPSTPAQSDGSSIQQNQPAPKRDCPRDHANDSAANLDL